MAEHLVYSVAAVTDDMKAASMAASMDHMKAVWTDVSMAVSMAAYLVLKLAAH